MQDTNHSEEKAPETRRKSQPAGKGNESAQPKKHGPGNKPGGQSPNPNQKNNQGGKGPGKPPVPKVVEVPPAAGPTRAKKRHWGLLLSFLLLVLVPLAVVIFYLFSVAKDQYSSTTGFTVRSEEAGGASDILGGLAQFAGQNTGTDSDVLYEFIQSQEIVARIDDDLDLRAHYAVNWDSDPIFSLWPDASVEDLTWYWQRVVRLSYDASSGLIDVQVLAFDPDMAQAVAERIVRESQDMINALNTQAREDAMRYAYEDLEEAVDRLKDAREALTRFRTQTQIVDPAADIQGRMGVLNNLQQQLAQALIEYDLLLENTTNSKDPRVVQAKRQIDVIRERIADERQRFASDGTELGEVGEDYPTLISEFESLNVDREVAEETYRAALTALDLARANASRQSRYLATYVKPTRAETAGFPQRYILSGLAGLFLLLAWSILALVYYSIRDRS